MLAEHACTHSHTHARRAARMLGGGGGGCQAERRAEAHRQLLAKQEEIGQSITANAEELKQR